MPENRILGPSDSGKSYLERPLALLPATTTKWNTTIASPFWRRWWHSRCRTTRNTRSAWKGSVEPLCSSRTISCYIPLPTSVRWKSYLKFWRSDVRLISAPLSARSGNRQAGAPWFWMTRSLPTLSWCAQPSTTPWWLNPERLPKTRLPLAALSCRWPPHQLPLGAAECKQSIHG